MNPRWPSPLPLIPLIAALGAAALAPATASAENCTEQWRLTNGKLTPLYPDTNAAYLAMNFVHEPSVALRIDGEFVHARFQNYTLYEDVGGTLVDKRPDFEIIPDEGSQNPFVPGVSRDVTDRSYTLWVAHEGTVAARGDNRLVIDGDHGLVRLIMRVYVPDDGMDDLGGMPWPEIEAFDARTLEPAACPETHRENGFDPDSVSAGLVESREDIVFFGTDGGTAYPSFDTAYIYARLDSSLGEVAIIEFRPPDFTETSGGGGTFTGDEEVRYWSMCLSWLESTLTPTCLIDSEVPVGRDGMVRIALAQNTPANRLAARRGGVGLLPWTGQGQTPMFIYRHILPHPDFPFGVGQVPPFDPELPQGPQQAENFIGEYAPLGVMCSNADFQADLCGMGR